MSVDYKLCNVLLSDGTRSDEYPDLYVKSRMRPYVQGEGAVALSDPGFAAYDFATYFNSFCYAKWIKYTTIDNVHLRIVAQGSFEVVLTAYQNTQAKPRRVVLDKKSFCFEKGYGTADLEYPACDAVLVSFEILTCGPTNIQEAYYYASVDQSQIRPVELAVAMTTIGKESYVIANVGQFKEQVLGCDEPVAKHLTVHVIDNGRTLDAASLEGERVLVHPNPNVGGSGGFTRGMIEALEQDPEPTHVLLMDDDVEVSSESIKRTYNMLSLMRDEYQNAFISGAMLSLERKDEFYEDMGYVTRMGVYRPAKEPRADDDRYCIGDLEDVVHLEVVEPHNTNCYAAWWYCCIPLPVIKDKGLPLPLFIRGDDVEYGNRAADHIITMNGICIWHMTFALKFRAAMERYQTVRNCLIAQAVSGVYPGVDFLTSAYVNFSLDLKTFNYDAAELGIMAIEDFLKGPEYLKHVNSEDLFKLVMSKNETLVPIDQIDDPQVRDADFNPALLYAEQERSLPTKVFDFVTFNGQRGPKRLARGGLGVIPYDGWFYPPNEIRGKDRLLAVTSDGTQGILRKKDRERFKELLKRYNAAMKSLDVRRDEINQQWAAAREELTSLEFWKWYLADQQK
ncbi:MAG: glycosyltransferase [Coriobacteriales bacterium]|nr:glycosyltransferase [Coriobacteriales bacterium]